MFGDFDTAVIFENVHFLLEGMQLTLVLTVVAILGGLLLGTLLALAPARRSWPSHARSSFWKHNVSHGYCWSVRQLRRVKS